MAGHSKWANIKHRKGAQDAKRGKIFTKLIREITIAARLGGADTSSNPRLRAAVQSALSNNMTRDTVDRAVKRGAGGEEGGNVDEIRYEGYGVGGIAIIVDCMTDNRNRTVAEVRHTFNKAGGNLGTAGSVAYMFEKRGIISFAPGCDEDKIMEVAIDAGADDVITNDDKSVDIITSAEDFSNIVEVVSAGDIKPDNAEVTMMAENNIVLDLEGAEKMVRLVDALEDLDDVQKVYTNADIPDDVLAKLA
jgi:YebC/PmpR family DNA-binding regulatory protein